MPKLICQNGHSETFNEGITMSTLMGWPQTVDADGNLISRDPNIHTTEFTCNVCGAKFTVRRQFDEVTIVYPKDRTEGSDT